MTVDSTYTPVDVVRQEGLEYSFEIESLGDEAMQVWIVVDGDRIRIPDYKDVL